MPHLSLIPYESDTTRKTRLAIVCLEQGLNDIERAIDAFYNAQYAFEREYQHRLGDLAEALMILRAQLGIRENKLSSGSATTQLVKQDYNQLKKAFRKAAKLCHPDNLSDAHSDKGRQWFDQLNKAYRLQDLVQVEHILWLLETGQAFQDNKIVVADAAMLERRQTLLQLLITQQQDHLAQLKTREDYDITNRDNWNILLYDYQTQLEDELAMLRGRAKISSGEE